jgi:hypothetical protein
MHQRLLRDNLVSFQYVVFDVELKITFIQL